MEGGEEIRRTLRHDRAGRAGDRACAVVLLRPHVQVLAPDAALADALAHDALRLHRLARPQDVDQVELDAAAEPPALAVRLRHHVGEEADRERALHHDLAEAELLGLGGIVVVVRPAAREAMALFGGDEVPRPGDAAERLARRFGRLKRPVAALLTPALDDD